MEITDLLADDSWLWGLWGSVVAILDRIFRTRD